MSSDKGFLSKIKKVLSIEKGQSSQRKEVFEAKDTGNAVSNGTSFSTAEERKAFLKTERSIERKAVKARKSFTEELSRHASLDETCSTAPDGNCSASLSDLLISNGIHLDFSVLSNHPADDNGLFQQIQTSIGSEFLPDTIFSRGEFDYFRNRFFEHIDITKTSVILTEMYLDWLFFCKNLGYDMDDYFDFEFYRKSMNERMNFASATLRENLRRILNSDPTILMRKGQFLKTFSRFIKRSWLDCSDCTLDEFRQFCEKNPTFFCKSEKGFGAEGLQKISPLPDEIGTLYTTCKERKSVLEAPISQHDSISSFNPTTVNSIRIVTVANADNIIIAGAAMRFGRLSGFADNYHQGGLCVQVNPLNGKIIGDAIDRTGKHYKTHPDSGLVFNGFTIPEWDQLCTEVKSAALFCIESNRFIGWDLAVTKEGDIDFIEGNSRPGFGILQAPNMTGMKSSFIEILKGLYTEEDLSDTRKGYWRKWKLDKYL